MEKFIELAKKLKCLADQGAQGERENAAQALDRLMKKHGIALEDIEEDLKKERRFEVPLKDQRLFFQICSNVLNCDTVNYRQSKRNKLILLFDLTDSQFIELDGKFNFYKEAYKKDLEAFYIAFINTNGLCIKSGSGKKREPRELTEEDLRAMEMMTGMSKHKFQKRLN